MPESRILYTPRSPRHDAIWASKLFEAELKLMWSFLGSGCKACYASHGCLYEMLIPVKHLPRCSQTQRHAPSWGAAVPNLTWEAWYGSNNFLGCTLCSPCCSYPALIESRHIAGQLRFDPSSQRGQRQILIFPWPPPASLNNGKAELNDFNGFIIIPVAHYSGIAHSFS